MLLTGKKIYLAGPMRNRPYFNFPAFFRGAFYLRENGNTVFSPAEHDVWLYGDFWRHCPHGSQEETAKFAPKSFSLGRCMLWDLTCILIRADTICLLPGWEDSEGAKIEKALAGYNKLEVHFLK